MDRYSIVNYIQGSRMESDSDGDYVLFTDHEATIADQSRKSEQEFQSLLGHHEAQTKDFNEQITALTESRDNAEERVKELTTERDRLREAVGDEKTHSATSDFCSSEWKNDCDELKDIVSRAARIIETVTPGSREEKDEQELWLEDAKAALAEGGEKQNDRL